MSTKPAVAVSGITGFIGAQVASALLTRGYTVHGTVRRNTPDRLTHLTTHPNASNLHVFEADLNTPGSFDQSLQNCKYAIHIASPFATDVKHPQTQLVDPAIQGTLSFLNSCKKAAVSKVVLTSSIAAVSDAGAHGETVDESDWNQHSSLKRLPYYYSKVCAERAAWDFVEKEAPDLTLVVINPVLVFGPSMVKSLNESAKILVSTVQGMFAGIIDLTFTTVDVRDVAEAHVRAMENDDAEGRYICAADSLLSHREITHIANQVGFKAPTRDLTGGLISAVMKFMSYVVPGGDGGAYVRNHLGNPVIPKNEKIKRDLGIEFRDPKDTVRETLEDLIKRDHLKKPTA